jgi:DeoR/GlpR family transcriptional regulator of sugar metabolism
VADNNGSVQKNGIAAKLGDRVATEMDANDRRQAIIDWVLRDGSVSNDDLVAVLGVSQMTIYRDFDLLEKEGWLRKVRGGATASPSALFERNVMFREREHHDEKAAVVRLALKDIEPGQAVFLDDSTTDLQLARMLPSRAPLTVITNSVSVINALSSEQDLKIIALGGTYSHAYNAFIGNATRDAARPFKADAAFISTSAITDGVCYHQSEDIIIVKQAMLASARRKVLLTDSSKFERQALYEFAPLTAFDLVIVDSRISKRHVTELREAGVQIEIAKLGGTGDRPA